MIVFSGPQALNHQDVDNGGASLVFVCSKLSAKLSSFTARAMAIATMNIKRTMKRLRCNDDIHTPRIADESIVMDMRKKESKKKQRSGNKTMGSMNRKTQEQKNKESIRKKGSSPFGTRNACEL